MNAMKQAVEEAGGLVLQYLLERFAADVSTGAHTPPDFQERFVIDTVADVQRTLESRLGFDTVQADTIKGLYGDSLRAILRVAKTSAGPTLQ